MAAPLGFKTFTTGEVLTAADTNGYLMQGVLVFADAAARSAAITSPQEGQTSYLKDTDEIQVYSGSAWVTKSGGFPTQTGNAGKYLTTDGTNVSWGTITGSAYTSITSGSIGSVTTFTLSSIPSTYKFLRLVLNGVKGTTRLAMRVNSDTGTNYFYKEMSLDAGRDSGSGGENLIRLHTQYNIYSTNASTWVLDFGNYATTASVKQITINALFISQLANLPAPIFGSGGWNNEGSAISSITVFTDGDTITAGTYTLYGVS